MNAIRSVVVRPHSLIPALAEVHLEVTPETLAGSELRGRLMGPRCRFASTIEVAYHLRPLPPSQSCHCARILIPEVSLWEPESPHLYAGPLELWHGSQRAATQTIRVGLRSLTQASGGLRLNGQPLTLTGKRLGHLDEPTALALRQGGDNLVVLAQPTPQMWNLADEIGLFVLLDGSTPSPEDEAHPACLGWMGDGIAHLTDAAGQPLRLGVRAGTGDRVVLGGVECSPL